MQYLASKEGLQGELMAQVRLNANVTGCVNKPHLFATMMVESVS